MTRPLPASANVAVGGEGARLCAPAATRNAEALCALLRQHAPREGRALEIASGTGQHVIAFARACPALDWQPTDIEPGRLASIDAYRHEADAPNIRAALRLDATAPGWSADLEPVDLVVIVNLLHLISGDAAETVLHEAIAVLRPGGRCMLYGPFMRAGQLTSDGDARFHTALTEADAAIGYKNDVEIARLFRNAGATGLIHKEMPANNLAFVATR